VTWLNDILLRSPQPGDADLILKWENDPENRNISDWNGPYSKEDIRALIRSLNEAGDQPEQIRMMIVDSGNYCYGAVDAFQVNHAAGKSGIGILIAEKKYRRKGIASSAIRQMEKHLFETYGVDHFEARIHDGNHASIRLFESLGYSKNATEHNAILPNADYIHTFELKL